MEYIARIVWFAGFLSPSVDIGPFPTEQECMAFWHEYVPKIPDYVEVLGMCDGRPVKKYIPSAAQMNWVTEIERGKKRKIPRQKPSDPIDRLIDWYETHKPEMPRVMPGGVALDAETLDQFAARVADGVWQYRGWRLVQTDGLPRNEKPTKISK
jgi:hypothetical protein